MNDTKIFTASTVDLITTTLKQNIISGRMARGQRLIIADIVDELNVSKGSVREALNRLEAECLIELIPNKGAVVKKIDNEEIIKLFQIREALEGYGARLAAQNINEGNNREELHKLLIENQHLQKTKDIKEFSEHNRKFHQFIASMGNNKELSILIDRYQLAVFLPLLERAVGTDNLIENALKQHEVLIEAIMNGDAETSYEAMASHLWSSVKDMLE